MLITVVPSFVLILLQKQRPQRKSTSEPVDVSKAHPLSLKLTFNMKSEFCCAAQT